MWWRTFRDWLGRWVCRLLDYDPPPRGILWPFPPSVSGGSFDIPPPASLPLAIAEPDIVLSINNTLDLNAGVIYSMNFPYGNRAHIANMGAGKIWFRVDGRSSAINDTQSELLPPGVADNDVVISSFVSIVSDTGATVVIRCHY